MGEEVVTRLPAMAAPIAARADPQADDSRRLPSWDSILTPPEFLLDYLLSSVSCALLVQDCRFLRTTRKNLARTSSMPTCRPM
ncbi:hypothetical protein LAZ40_06200 [Cereibacter sphaeroides]|uniref:hypothetical protein n=1 Tax=Cereibacter sphaeroides TaxID=1063 RepID=UPI001F337579|nr:hypothetical protein [Cereibacter sphaeroides]MCE6949479.1 hypothetical protein [Cereibacter sphaeroides]MCE6958639.1 hypothetical protein [Cereibacter sphaeroides]MCE6973478.1 hypothetical protein [Cereibacter sphaeroides]